MDSKTRKSITKHFSKTFHQKRSVRGNVYYVHIDPETEEKELKLVTSVPDKFYGFFPYETKKCHHPFLNEFVKNKVNPHNKDYFGILIQGNEWSDMQRDRWFKAKFEWNKNKASDVHDLEYYLCFGFEDVAEEQEGDFWVLETHNFFPEAGKLGLPPVPDQSFVIKIPKN